MTRAQLVARVRLAMGEEPRRHTVGAYRWSPPAGVAAEGAPTVGPWRVAQKPARSREEPREPPED